MGANYKSEQNRTSSRKEEPIHERLFKEKNSKMDTTRPDTDSQAEELANYVFDQLAEKGYSGRIAERRAGEFVACAEDLMARWRTGELPQGEIPPPNRRQRRGRR